MGGAVGIKILRDSKDGDKRISDAELNEARVQVYVCVCVSVCACVLKANSTVLAAVGRVGNSDAGNGDDGRHFRSCRQRLEDSPGTVQPWVVCMAASGLDDCTGLKDFRE